MIRRAVAALALVLASCACGPPEEPVCFVSQARFGDWIPVGRPATVQAGLHVSCSFSSGQGPLRVVKEVEVEVLDPDNKRVAASATAPVRVGGNDSFETTTDVSFLPDRPGAWTVIVRYEPNLGRTQQPLRTYDLRTDAGMRALPTLLPQSCIAYGLTASNRPLCMAPGLTFEGNQLLIGDQRFSGREFAIDGDAIWALVEERNPAGLDLIQPDDAGVYGVTHQTPLFGSARDMVLAAGGGAAHLYLPFVGGSDVLRYTPEADGGLTLTVMLLGAGRVPSAVAPDADRMVVLAAVDGGTLVLSYFPDGGVETQAGGRDLRSVSHGHGTLWAAQNGTLVAFDWSSGVMRTGSIADTQPANGALGFSHFPLSPQVPLLRRASLVAQTTPVIAVPVAREGDLGLEGYALPPGYDALATATARHVFARSTDGARLLVIDR